MEQHIYIYIKITTIFAYYAGYSNQGGTRSAHMLSLQGMSACNLLDFESTKTCSINYVNIHAARPHVVRFGKVKSGLPCLHILN